MDASVKAFCRVMFCFVLFVLGAVVGQLDTQRLYERRLEDAWRGCFPAPAP